LTECVLCVELDPWGGGGIGRRSGLKIHRPRGLEGSSPSRPTKQAGNPDGKPACLLYMVVLSANFGD
jgi:hypothetical protein